jgi:hypothetical protein
MELWKSEETAALLTDLGLEVEYLKKKKIGKAVRSIVVGHVHHLALLDAGGQEIYS